MRYIVCRYTECDTRRRTTHALRFLLTLAATAGLLLAVGAPLASADGTHHAAASFVDASGTPIGWARLVEDARGVVH